LDEDRLVEWIAGRRWFGAKSREVAHAHVLDVVTVADPPPGLAIAIVEARFPAGTHDLYQLPLAARPADEGWDEAVVQELDGVTVYDALVDPEACALLAGLLRDRTTIGEQGEGARIEFHWLDGVPPPSAQPTVRAIGAEQSNSSIVIDDALVLKAFRRVEAGESPELEMLRFLSARDFPNIAELGGWYDYSGELMTSTLGVVQRYVEGGRDGWEMVLDGLGDEPDALLERLRGLGGVVGQMHTVLASDMTDPAFSPEEPGEEALPLMTATLDEQIERLFIDLPDGDERLEPIRGRGEEVRDRLRLASHLGGVGRAIRHHGDFHLGQTLLTSGDDGDRWIILDFEGEPARPLIDRRRKRSPLRDVAGLLRSLAYAVSAARLQRDVSVPDEWEQSARTAFLEGYYDAVEPSLLPPGAQATRTLLGILELEKAIYELRYELDHRPDWVPIPVAAIARMLESPLE
jgi:trehalose synthase-fused probable maltokinase